MVSAGGHTRPSGWRAPVRIIRWMGHTEAERNRARLLRAQGDSLAVIAMTLGIPRSTIGDWVRGMEGEAAMLRYCGWCGEAFLAIRRDREFCNNAHRMAHHRAQSPAGLRPCAYCGEEYDGVAGSRYCCREHYWADHRGVWAA